MRLASLPVLVAIIGLSQTARLPAQAPPPVMQVDVANSHVYARVNAATRLGHSHGIIGNLASGNLTLGGTGELVFDMTTFVADGPDARKAVGLDPNFSASDAQKVNANMRGADVLDVAKFPRATYKIASMRPLDGQAAGGPSRYMVSGTFTLHGVSQQCPFEATVSPACQSGAPFPMFEMRGDFTISQTTYGIQPFSAMAGLVKVSDEMKIWGVLILRQQPPGR
jgi:polyisoprenoid-binding protein YceI